MAKAGQRSAEDMRTELFALLREQKDAIVGVAAHDTGIRPERLGPAFEEVLDLVAEPIPSPAQIDRWRDQGVELAREGAASELVYDAYLSLNWAVWEAAMQAGHIEREVILDFADRLLRGLDDAIAAISEGYMRVELELASAHSSRRRAVLEDLLTSPRSTPQDRARIRLRAERHGLTVADQYRLVLVDVGERREDEVEALVDEVEMHIRVPATGHRTKPGIRLPVVLDWRGRLLILAKVSWRGEQRLREAVLSISGGECVAVDTGPIEGIEAVADALTQADYSVTVAQGLGRRGWIGGPGEMALETMFLLDEPLARMAIDKELGALLSDPRMGDELIETLEVYLGSRQNIRETARRLHLAPRTVAYRLERIEALLGHDLEGDHAARLGAALLALRVRRQADALRRDPDADQD